MNIKRHFTATCVNPFECFTYTKRSSVLRNPDGSIVFEMHDIEVPAHWSQMATDILAQKYFRKTGVPQFDDKGNKLLNEDGSPNTAHTTNLVPCILIDKDYKSVKDGKLGDIAPTVLNILGVTIPPEMSGNVLV